MKILFALLFLFVAGSADAAVYYVKKTGSDSNNCTQAQTESTPKLTITSALGCFNPATAGSGAGHTVRVYAGVYAEAINNIIPGGTSWTNPFTIEKNPGDTVEIRPTSCAALIVIDVRRGNSKYFQIKGTSFTDRLKITAGNGTCSNNAIKFATSTSLGTTTLGRLQYLEVTGALNQGIQFTASASANEIRDNWIHTNGSTLNVDDTHGMYLASADNLIEGNLVENNCNRGLQIYNSGTNNAHRNIVRRNIFRTNGTCESSANVVLSSGNDIQFYGNFVYGGNSTGVSVTANSPQRMLIYNNTIYNNSGAGISVQSGASGTRIINNIIRSNGSTVSDSGTSTVQSNSLTTDPTFISAGTGNLCLSTGSAAIGAGTATIATSPATVTRIANGTPDIGACETFGHTSARVTGNTVDVTFGMNLNVPVLPSSAITGFTVNNGRTVTSAVRVADSLVRLTFDGAACTGGQTWTYSYSPGNLTDSALIGGSQNQRLNTITAQSVTNECAVGSTATFTQVAYQFYLLRNDPTGNLTKLPTVGAPVSSSIKAATGSVFSLEIQTNCDNVADCPPIGQTLQYDINLSGSWVAVTDTCGDVCFYGASDTSAAIPTGVPMCPLSGALTCVDGGTQKTAAAVPVIDLAQNNSTVNRYLVKVQPSVDQVFRFRLINQDGTAYGAYSAYPTITGIGPTAGVGM